MQIAMSEFFFEYLCTYLQREWKHWFLHSKPYYVQLHAVPQFFHLLTPQVPIHLNLKYWFDTSNYWKHHEQGFLQRHRGIHLLLWSKCVLIIRGAWLCYWLPFLTRYLLTNQNTTDSLKDQFWRIKGITCLVSRLEIVLKTYLSCEFSKISRNFHFRMKIRSMK